MDLWVPERGRAGECQVAGDGHAVGGGLHAGLLAVAAVLAHRSFWRHVAPNGQQVLDVGVGEREQGVGAKGTQEAGGGQWRRAAREAWMAPCWACCSRVVFLARIVPFHRLLRALQWDGALLT